MRQLFIEVPSGRGQDVLTIAARHGAMSSSQLATADDRPHEIVLVHLPNGQLDALIEALESTIEKLRVTWHPQGTVALEPPAAHAPAAVAEVSARSPIEIFLSGLQSVGSWNAFLGYAAAAGIIVWIGLFTETIFLLTAAMLIAPFAGPAMNAALATARGDQRLFLRALGRYFAALALTIVIAFLLTLAFSQNIATPLMVQTSFLSSAAVLLPLVAGAAGALNLCQSERSSLVSGAATGMLVAASLAPQAGLIGMGAAIGEWEMAGTAVFVLVMQLVGINLAGAAVFGLYGVAPRGVRFARGTRRFRAIAATASLAALSALLYLQFHDTPDLQQSTRAQRAAADVRDLIETSGLALPVEIDVRFTRADIPGQNTLLATIYVQLDGAQDRTAVEQALERDIGVNLARDYDVQPLIDVRALTPP